MTMGYRVFKDSRGVEWQAWDVVPQLTERRDLERRVKRAPVAQDRRRAHDRRLMLGRRPMLMAELDAGWLCFEALQEKRRLTPIPTDWLRCPERQLEQYCHSAKRAPRPATSAELTDDANILR